MFIFSEKSSQTTPSVIFDSSRATLINALAWRTKFGLLDSFQYYTFTIENENV